MKLTKKQAKELSIKKWEYIVENGGSSHGLIDALPELSGLLYECGYCEKYRDCGDCPISLKKGKFKYCCGNFLHPWTNWCDNPTKANAQRVLDLIKK